MLAITVTDQIGLGSIIIGMMMFFLGVPSAYLAWRSVQSNRRTARASLEAAERARETERIGRVVKDQIDRVLNQLTPSNGRTTAHTVESIERKLDDNTSKFDKVVDDVTVVVEEVRVIKGLLSDHLRDHREMT
jgi:hypothetical protein